MKPYGYWRSKGEELIAQQEKRLDAYGDRISDIPTYIVIYFYVFMTLITPKRKDITKYE